MTTQRHKKSARPNRQRTSRTPGSRKTRGTAAVTPRALTRLRPDVSLRSLSEQTGVSLSLLSRLFNGKRRLTVRVARLLATALDMDVEAVMDALVPRGDTQAA